MSEEEVEVKVRQIGEEDKKAVSPESAPIVDVMRRLLLASIGAVAMTYDETERMIGRLVERGELAQKDGEKILNEVMGRFRQTSQDPGTPGGQIEAGLESILTSLNIPTQRDIDNLSTKIAQLAERLDDLRTSK